MVAGPVDPVADAHCVGADDSEAVGSCLSVEGSQSCSMRRVESSRYAEETCRTMTHVALIVFVDNSRWT